MATPGWFQRVPSAFHTGGPGVDAGAARPARVPGAHAQRAPGPRDGERSRWQLLFQLAGAETMLVLAVNVLADNGALPLYIVSKSVFYIL